MNKFLKEFKEFISRGNVMDMAVGIIIGGAFTSIVSSLVEDIINPILGIFGGMNFDSSSHWRRVMQGHAAANLMPVVAANRIGVETVEPCKENAGQSSSLDFYGT